jgi:hypothetical protein
MEHMGSFHFAQVRFTKYVRRFQRPLMESYQYVSHQVQRDTKQGDVWRFLVHSQLLGVSSEDLVSATLLPLTYDCDLAY